MTISDRPMFDLQDAIEILRRALNEARRLDGVLVPTTDDGGVKKGDPAVALANRDIQFVMHLCDRASAEVSTAYWASRGYYGQGPTR